MSQDPKRQTTVDREMAAGERFEFGKNWANYLRKVDDARIGHAALSLQQLFKGRDLVGKAFLDAGSGSGLMSLAARKLGMRVVSFDYDPASVACTTKLKSDYFPSDSGWLIYQGSVLDKPFLLGLGTFDFVYSWGVLHHTGDLWKALDNLLLLVAGGGLIAVALYNDQGMWSKVWRLVKASYNKLPKCLKPLFVISVMGPRELKMMAVPLLKGKFQFVIEQWSDYGRGRGRGMSRWHDMIDWIGGYPFEVCKPEEVFYFVKERGLSLIELCTCAGELGCNEYVFEKR